MSDFYYLSVDVTEAVSKRIGLGHRSVKEKSAATMSNPPDLCYVFQSGEKWATTELFGLWSNFQYWILMCECKAQAFGDSLGLHIYRIP